MSGKSFRRYTDLASVIHILRNRCITLLNPASWDDRNDAFFLAQYKERHNASSVLALCFAEAPETYHHWRVFSSGSDGICLEFDKDKLLAAVKMDQDVIAGAVNYKQVNTVRSADIADNDLPFLKRYPYRDEQEYRLLYVSHDIELDFHDISIPVGAITRIILSPWLAEALVKPVKETLKDVKGCAKLKVYRSTLIENERWKAAASSTPK